MNINAYTAAELVQMILVADQKIDPTASAITTRRVHQIAEAKGWGIIKVGKQNFYSDIDDVQDWLSDRKRTKIQHQLGMPKGTQYKHDDYDFDCLECGCLAVPRWPENPKQAISWLRGELVLPWMCENGHRGKNLFTP